MFTAIIPVRKGSRRLKGKNVAPFAGTTLLEYKIDQLKQVKEIGNIVVSSDCDDMLAMAARKSVITHKRADEYCDEISQPFGAVVSHICENVTGDDIIWATCTSPLVEPLDYKIAIELYKDKILAGFDSLMSVEEFRRYIWNSKGPLNYELGLKHVPSQQLEPLYRVTDGILIAPRSKMIEWKYFHGPKPFMHVIDKRSSVDIDDPLDMACAIAWLNEERNQ
jgi:N-acylneuraminate cytidylyltransferase